MSLRGIYIEQYVISSAILTFVLTLPQLVEVAEGLVYLHSQAVVHGDIKEVWGILHFVRCIAHEPSGQHTVK
jgi:serine/threonine protein kinase